MISFFKLSKDDIIKKIVAAGFPAFRGKQLIDWVYNKNVFEIDSMTNLDKAFKEFLINNIKLINLETIKLVEDEKGETIKFLLLLGDRNTIEMVIMRYLDKDSSKNRNTLCLSSQVGCKVKCPFCATGTSGLVRNLKAEEIVQQVSIANSYLKQFNAQINNIVFMGMGEPFYNKDEVLQAASLIRENYEISSRKIAISTSGIIEGIKELADKDLKYVLAISLHAPTDRVRDYLVPINKKYPLNQLIKACRYYQQKTKKRITFEYIMIDSMNIWPDDARQLANLLKGIDCHINGIPVNSVSGSEFKRPKKKDMYEFKKLCEEYGLSFSIREEKGTDIDGACGQLRNKERK
ncbi:MAG: 23S rRNA (adenine(2503)-C(2))-methyltransferase RlmN [Firmicutes bacterium]|nr:23S rRNA (adenine(2503)-C(2))-methyltransferase RlmN [Bacillota bacterium]